MNTRQYCHEWFHRLRNNRTGEIEWQKKVKGNCTQSQPKEKNYMTLLLELLTSRILRITVLRGRTAYVYRDCECVYVQDRQAETGQVFLE